MGDVRLTVMKAITTRSAVTAYYNGGLIKLAPHLLFERHGGLYVRAENITKAMRSADERRLGQFKLDGLVEAQLLEESFEPLPAFEPTTPRPEDNVILAI